jgi:hypothetical protein
MDDQLNKIREALSHVQSFLVTLGYEVDEDYRPSLDDEPADD